MDQCSTNDSAKAALHPGRAEWLLAGGVVLSLLVLRWLSTYNQPWSSDEPQHLHVVWAWANGLLPYRDVFDNHTPLFHLLYAPFFRYLGERPDILEPMRLAIFPLFVVCIACIYRLGCVAFSPRAGLWGALFASLHPLFFYKMAEFRTDVLWAALWLVTLVILTGGPLTRWRLFLSGVALGATFAVSMKTILLLGVVLTAGALIALRFRREEPARPFRAVALDSAAAIAGLALIPGLLLGFFASQGALDPLYYCVITHNTIPGEQTASELLKRFIEFPHPLLFLCALVVAFALPLYGKGWPRLKTRLFLVLVAVLFYPMLHSFWPKITGQSNLPWYPLVMLCIAPVLVWLAQRCRLPAAGLLAFLLVVQGVWMWQNYESSSRSNRNRIRELALALQLTKKGETVMDAKGEVIFRPRPYYYVLETITSQRLAMGLLPDEISASLIESRTAVIRPSRRLTAAAQEFVDENYVSIGKFYVLGQHLKRDIAVRITIPGEYTVIGKKGPVPARLNGEPFSPTQWLDAGEYKIEVESPADRKAALIWTRAASLGLSPFRKRTP